MNDGDELIWVLDKKTNTAFVVDLAQHTGERATPNWLITKDADGNVIGGIYKDILDEQGANVGKHTVTIETTGLPANKTIAPKVIATVANGANVTFNFATAGYADPYDVEGYRLKVITPANGATLTGGTGVTQSFTANNNWTSAVASMTLTGVKENVTITFEYEPAEYSVELTAAPKDITGGALTMGTNGVAATDNATPANTATLSTTPGTTNLTTNVGSTVTVTLDLSSPGTALAAYEELSVKVVEKGSIPTKNVPYTVNTTNTSAPTITFTMPAKDVAITVDVVAKTANITYMLNNEVFATDTWTPANSTDTYDVDNNTIFHGYTLTNWEAYETGKAPMLNNKAGNSGTLVIGNWRQNITIVLDAALTEYTLDFDTTAWTAGQVWYSLNGGAEVLVVDGTTTPTVTVKDTISLRISGDATGSPTVGFTSASNGDAAKIGPFPPTGANTFEWTGTISGIYTTGGVAPVIEVK